MKEDREFKWMINLLSSNNFSNNLFYVNGGRFSDFEICANNSARDKYFSKWFKFLLKEKVVNFLEYKENSKGRPFKIYSLDKNKLIKIFEKYELFKKLDKIYLIADRM